MIVNKNENNSTSYCYSDKLNRYRFSKKLDQFSKYHIRENDLERLYATYGKNDYQKFDHGYKQINKQINKAVELSYSQINSFYQCPFKYYVEKVLKLNDEKSQFYMQLGNIFHEVLKEVFENDITDEKNINDIIDKKINKVIKLHQYTESEKYFTKSLKQELLKDIEIIRNQHQQIGFDNYEYEKQVDIKIDENISFNGVIDKLIHKQIDNDKLIAVVDYKTGSEEYKENMIEDGLSLQLPSYLYLTSKLFEKENKKYAGFYIQHLINTDNKYEVNKPIEVKKLNSMKLNGKSNSDENFNILEHFDQNFRESELINIYVSKEDKISYKKGIDNVGIDKLIQLTEEKISEAGKAILKNDFPILPYEYEEACKHCTYSDICYRKSSDLRI